MYAAVDIGGTKTLVAVFSEDGKIVEQVKFPTASDFFLFTQDFKFNVEKLTTKDFTCGAVAFAGKPDRTLGIGLVCGNLPWENVPLRDTISTVLKCPVILENDAKAAGLSEAIALGKKYTNVLYVTLGTGIGAALILNGRIDPRFQDMEAGQLLLVYNDRLTDWEDFASGRAFTAHFGKRVDEVDDPAAWYWLARNIAIGLIDLIVTLTPEVIILGGGVSKHLDKFQDRLDEQLKIYENPLVAIPPIRQALRSDEAVIYGCYELARNA